MQTSGSFEDFVKKIQLDMETRTREAEDLVLAAAEKGEAVMKHFIETRGTAKSGKRGRIETGDMRDSVGSDVRKATAEEIEVAFGWLGETPEHAKFQETGFRHSGGVQVTGMYALTDAFEEVVTDLEEDIGRIMGK